MNQAYYEKTFLRHKNDLLSVESCLRDDIRFNKALGAAYIAVIEQLHHVEGELAGSRIKLEPWQKKAIAICFGWQKKRIGSDGSPVLKDGVVQWIRRFNTAFWFLSRKNGKSLLSSGVALAESVLSIENGNQIVTFATKRDQAKIVWSVCEKMAKMNKDLKKHSKVSYSTISVENTMTSIKPLSKDSKSYDGLNVGMAIGDEIHALPDRSMIEVIESSMGSRIQPMMFYITTAGFNTASPGYNEYEYACNVLDGVINDDEYFAFVAKLDDDDDPFDESVWYKANPNLGVSKTWDYMRKAAKQAKERPETKNNFLVKDLNVWVNSNEEFISRKEWMDCEGYPDLDNADGVIIGIDLSLRDDFTSKATLYVLPDDRYHVKLVSYIPSSNILDRERFLRAPVGEWVSKGHIITTPGNVINHGYIIKDVIEQIDTQNVMAIAFDRAHADYFINKIENEKGYENCIAIGQGPSQMNEPIMLFRNLIRSGKLTHENDPVLNWMISNVVLSEPDQYNRVNIDKSSRERKIDGVAALLNTIRVVVSQREEQEIDINSLIG